MNRNFNKKEILDSLNESMKNISTLYISKSINRKGKIIDSKSEYYTEIVSNELLKRLSEFDKIDRVSIKSPYIIKNHGSYFNAHYLNRRKENFATLIYGKEYEGLGKIIDYKIPIKEPLSKIGIVKIDLLSYHVESSTLYLINLKLGNSKDTLLKSIIEIYTYWLTIDIVKLKKDIIDYCPFINELKINVEKLEIINIKPAVMAISTFENGCNPFKENKEMEIGKRPILKELSNKLGVKIFSPDIRYFQT